MRQETESINRGVAASVGAAQDGASGTYSGKTSQYVFRRSVRETRMRVRGSCCTRVTRMSWSEVNIFEGMPAYASGRQQISMEIIMHSTFSQEFGSEYLTSTI